MGGAIVTMEVEGVGGVTTGGEDCGGGGGGEAESKLRFCR